MVLCKESGHGNEYNVTGYSGNIIIIKRRGGFKIREGMGGGIWWKEYRIEWVMNMNMALSLWCSVYVISMRWPFQSHNKY